MATALEWQLGGDLFYVEETLHRFHIVYLNGARAYKAIDTENPDAPAFFGCLQDCQDWCETMRGNQ